MVGGIEINQLYLLIILIAALVYGPGHYQFGDFVKVGVPLTLIVAVIVSFMAPMLWPG